MTLAEKFEIIADEVYDNGVYDEKVRLTNAITDNGARANFSHAFAYTNYSGVKFAETITPNYYINHMFYSCYNMTELPTPLDFSKILETATDAYAYRRSVFGYCRKLEIVPDLNMRAIGGLEEWFIQCYKLHTIELLRVHRDTIYNITFSQCNNLQNITFDGEIGQSISFKDSPLLSVASMKNIIKNNLVNLAQEGLDRKIITFADSCWTRIESSGTPKDDGIDFEGTWRNYVDFLGWDT